MKARVVVGPHGRKYITYEPLLHEPKQPRAWVELIRGVRVDGDTVVISVKGGNDAARHLCGELVKELNT